MTKIVWVNDNLEDTLKKIGPIIAGARGDEEKEPVEKAFAGEQVTFEDIKPYVSMQKDSGGKTNYVVLDKDEKSIFQSLNSKDAMNFLSKNFNALRQGGMKPVMPAHWESKSLKESRTKIVEAIKSKTGDHAQNISGIEGDSDRVTGEAGLQIARIKYLSNYQN